MLIMKSSRDGPNSLEIFSRNALSLSKMFLI